MRICPGGGCGGEGSLCEQVSVVPWPCGAEAVGYRQVMGHVEEM